MSDLPNFNYDPSSLPPPPPSSVHGEIDEDDNHLPVDDSFHHRDVNFDSTNEDENHQHINGVRDNTVDGTEADEVLASSQNDQSQPPILPSPQQPELTLKEKLVLRERQQRIETERARLKRQFALSSTNEEIDTLNNDDGTLNRTQDDINHPAMESLPGDIDDTTGNYNGREFEEESTRAHPDEEEAVADEANRRLGFNMERFLRNSESFHPELENALEADRTMPSGESSTDATKGVVMERFLNDMVSNTNHMLGEVEPTEQTGEPHRSVSFDVDATVTTQVLPHSVQSQMLNHQQESLLTSMHPSFGGESTGGVSIVSNASMRTEANTVHDEYFNTVDPPLYSSSSLENMHENDRASLDDVSSRVSDDEPRVLRLTEADMLEMAAIEEASIGNAPPSDRDEVESYSEIGELTDFGGSGGGMHRFLGDPTFNGPDTPTTALESASQLSQRSAAHIGGTSALSSSATNEHTDVDIFAGHLDLIEGMPIPASDRSHYFVASASASVAANPPSEGERDDDDDDEIMDNESHLNDVDLGTRTDDNAGVLPYSFSVNDGIANLPSSDLGSDTVGAADASHVDVAPIANRPRHYNPNDSSIDGSRIENAEHDNVVDGFDFDKDAPLSPFHNRTIRGALGNDDSFRNLPNDLWSPPGRMHISPLQVGDRAPPLIAVKESMAVPMPFESADIRSGERSTLTSIEDYKSSIPSEMTPLLSGDSPHLATDMLESRRGTTFTIAESDPVCTDALITEKKTGNSASFLEKAFDERQLALLVTLVLQIPVVMLITGGSDALCGAVGRVRYQLTLGFLPAICAISGNAALQSREVAMHAIATGDATSPIKNRDCFTKEITTTVCHGIVMGIALGIVAYFVSGFDIIFGVTILFVQLFSILTSGVTGTIVPLLCSSTMKREAGRRSLLLVTAIQDIFGSFATIVLAYYIIVILSSKGIDATDRCIVNLNP